MPELLSSTAAFAPPAVPVIWRRHSWADPIRELRPAGQSLAEIVRSLPELPPRFWEDGIITVGDQPVPRHMWARVRPKPKEDDSIDVALWLAPGGQVLRIVATVALIAAVSLVSGGALAFPAFGGLFAAGSVSAALAAASVGILGSLAINALTPPPSSNALDPNAGSGTNDKTPASLQGNVLRPGASIPHVRGTRKIFPPVVVKPFVDLQGENEVVTAVVALAGHHSITDIRSDGASLASMDEVTYETRSGGAGDTLITLVDFQSKTDANQLKLSQHDIQPNNTATLVDQVTPTNSIPHWHAMRAVGAPDEVRINLLWTQGLFDQNLIDTDIIVPVRTRIRAVGSSTWINLPEVFFTHHKQLRHQRDIRIIWGTAPALPTPADRDAPIYAIVAVPMRVITSLGVAGLNHADGNLGTGVTFVSGTTGYLGGDFGTQPRPVSAVTIDSQTGSNFTSTTVNITFNLRGKNSSPSSSSDGTLLGFITVAGAQQGRMAVMSNDIVTAYRFLWVEWTTPTGTTTTIADLRFMGENDYSWLAHSHFWSTLGGSHNMNSGNIGSTPVRNIALYPDSARVYLDPVTFPKGDYEIEIKRGATDKKTDFSIDRYAEPAGTGHSGNLYVDFFRWVDFAGFVEVPRDTRGVYHEIVRQRFQLKWNEHPLLNAPGNLALIAIRSTNRAMGQISCLASRYVLDWDGAGWNTQSTTSNPAAHVRDILAGELNADPVPADLIDDAGLVAWRTHANAMGYQVNAVIESQSAAVAAQLCAACGYARMRQSETFGVIIDKDRSLESPVQTFTARNARNYQWQSDKIRFPSGFRAIYADSTNDYEDAEIIVLDPAGDQGARFEEVRYDGFVTAAEAQARALFDLAQARARLVTHTFESNQQAIKCKRGDLIGLNHPILTEQMGAAYIREILGDDAGNVTGFLLDGSVPTSGSDGFFTGPDDFIPDIYGDGFFKLLDLGLAVRLKDGNELTAQVAIDGSGAERDSRTVILSAPVAIPVGLERDCLVTVGALGSERLRLIIGEIAPKAGDQFPQQIIAVDEAPSIWI